MYYNIRKAKKRRKKEKHGLNMREKKQFFYMLGKIGLRLTVSTVSLWLV
jgi:hypothetical protein